MSQEGLNAFVASPKFSTEREKMMEHWLCAKIYEACFARHIRPLIYTTEYDRGGFDLAVGIGSEFREFQLKVVAAGSSTKTWDIASSLLCPKIDMLHDLMILAEGNAFGRMGGVILMEVAADARQMKGVRLFYTDITVLAFRHLRQGHKDRPSSELFSLFQTPLARYKKETKGKITLTKASFIEVPSVASLLTLAGLRLSDLSDFQRQLRTSFRPVVMKRSHAVRKAGECWLPMINLKFMMKQILQIKH